MKAYFKFLAHRRPFVRLAIILASSLFMPHILSWATQCVANFFAREITMVSLGIIAGSYLIVGGMNISSIVSKVKGFTKKVQTTPATSGSQTDPTLATATDIPIVHRSQTLAEMAEEVEAGFNPKEEIEDEPDFEDDPNLM